MWTRLGKAKYLDEVVRAGGHNTFKEFGLGLVCLARVLISFSKPVLVGIIPLMDVLYCDLRL